MMILSLKQLLLRLKIIALGVLPVLTVQAAPQEIIQITANRSLITTKTLSNNINLNKEQIALANSQHLNQILGQVSGSWLSRGNGQESLLALRSPVFTGAGACNEFLLMQDGIELRAPGFCNVNELFDTTTEFSEQIDVIKGSHSAQYGSSAIHGVINVLSPTPNEELIKSALTLGPDGYLKLNTQYSNTSSVPTFLGLSFGHDGGYQHSSGYDQQKLLLKTLNSFNQVDIRNQISITNLSQQTAGYLQSGKNSYKDSNLTRENSIPHAYRHATSVNAHSRFSLEKYDTTWAITPYIRWNEMQFLMHYLPGEPTEKNGHYSIGTQAIFQYQLNNSILTSGLDIDFTEGFLQQYQVSETNSGSDFLNAILPSGKHYDYTISARNIALYAGIEHKTTEKVTASINVRLDSNNYRYNNKMLAGNTKDDGSECAFSGCRYTRPEDRQDRFNNLSWSTQISYLINNNSSTYLKLDKAFRAPHTSELYRLQNGQIKTSINSENAHSVELGYQLNTNTNKLKLSIYQIDKSDVIFQDSLRNYVDDAAMQHQGIELDLNHNVSNTLSTELNLSYAKHIYTNDPDLTSSDIKLTHNYIDTAPNLIGSTRINWQYGVKSLIQLEYQYMSKYFLNPENTAEYSGHQLVNMRWQQQLSQNVDLNIQWLNIFNTQYAERADFAFEQYRYFVGYPSRVYIQLSYTL
ncbi:TonB-dependent receptor [Catenovulum sp. 2E275]|uniref:TonB-dependent receptor n=1 Tax=Catenovulum sp. 2E275 TaxID=2980497 RepID=UPI0021D0CEF8|nr:TonB-dependent receptor [Catenovulum sp. 2E275]MCU4674043.1 TonB-dependent receptor [Catenovulum sp. 2E275]